MTRNLFTLPVCIGDFFGSAARMYSALANSEIDVWELSRSRYVDYTEVSHRRGYIESVERVFPELGQVERLREIMLKHSQSSFTDADNRFQVVVQTLKRLCGCASAKETFRPSDRNSKSQVIQDIPRRSEFQSLAPLIS